LMAEKASGEACLSRRSLTDRCALGATSYLLTRTTGR
jgi:hypothetical protein